MADAVILLLCGALLTLIIVKPGEYFFNMLTRKDYITKDDCKKCVANELKDDVEKIKNDFKKIKRVLVKIAVKLNISDDELTEMLQETM